MLMSCKHRITFCLVDKQCIIEPCNIRGQYLEKNVLNATIYYDIGYVPRQYQTFSCRGIKTHAIKY